VSFYTLNVTIHILAAMLWLGGMLFFAVVGAPVVRRLESDELRRELFRALGEQFRIVGWICIGVLVATGTANLLLRGITFGILGSGSFWSSGYGRTLAVKLVLVAAMIGISVVHDFFQGPRASRAIAEPETVRLRLRRQASLLGRLNALLGIVVVWLAVLLTRGS